MTNTLYANPHGLDCLSKLEAYSVLGDQALLIKTLLSYSECITIIGKCEHVG
jgi:D-alanyl-D-alanine carboxypeptidase